MSLVFFVLIAQNNNTDLRQLLPLSKNRFVFTKIADEGQDGSQHSKIGQSSAVLFAGLKFEKVISVGIAPPNALHFREHP